MKKLYRGRNGVIGGVCDGIGEYFSIDGVFIRLLFFVLIFSPFPAFLTYILSWIVIPKKPKIL